MLGVAGRRVVGKGQETGVDLEEGVGERMEDTMVVEVLGKVPESLTLHSEIEELGMGNSTDQQKLDRIPLMDISMGEQLTINCLINEEGRKDKGNWKRRARQVGMEKNPKEQRLPGGTEITEKKRSLAMDDVGQTAVNCEHLRKKSRVNEQMKENVSTMVGETSLNWSQVDQ